MAEAPKPKFEPKMVSSLITIIIYYLYILSSSSSSLSLLLLSLSLSLLSLLLLLSSSSSIIHHHHYYKLVLPLIMFASRNIDFKDNEVVKKCQVLLFIFNKIDFL